MTVLALDNFVDTHDTNLESHTSDTGDTWARRSDSDASGHMIIIVSGSCGESPNGFTEHCQISLVPPTADYTVEGTIFTNAGTGNQFSTISGRSSTDGLNGYGMYLDRSGPWTWNLFKLVAGVNTALGSWSSGWGATESHVAQLVLAGTSITAVFDGTTRITASDGDIGTIGKCGIGGLGALDVPGSSPVFTQFRVLSAVVTTAPTIFRRSSMRRR